MKDTIIAQLLEDRAVLQKKLVALEESHAERVGGMEKEKESLMQALAKLGSGAKPSQGEADGEGRVSVGVIEEVQRTLKSSIFDPWMPMPSPNEVKLILSSIPVKKG